MLNIESIIPIDIYLILLYKSLVLNQYVLGKSIEKFIILHHFLTWAFNCGLAMQIEVIGVTNCVCLMHIKTYLCFVQNIML